MRQFTKMSSSAVQPIKNNTIHTVKQYHRVTDIRSDGRSDRIYHGYYSALHREQAMLTRCKNLKLETGVR